MAGNMKPVIMFLALTIVLSLQGCEIATRTERDIYTITNRDTTYMNYVRNAPGSRDRGVVYPSSRDFKSEREKTQRDSIVERHYPDFIRLGLFESIGTIGGSSSNGIGAGLFGVFPNFSQLDEKFRGGGNTFFTGGIYRVGISEHRLRWFRDAKNWTYGFHLFEAILPDARIEKAMMGIMPFYLRKRYFLREEIPYITLTPAFGIGLFPSQYFNLSGSLDVGSIGGMNIRAYVGISAGTNPATSFQVRSSDQTKEAQSIIQPYFGIGFSTFDFLNKVEETYKEWKDHEHSSWNVGLIQLGVLSGGSGQSVFALTSTKTQFFSGFMLRLATASVALPYFDYKLYAGTSLINVLALNNSEWGAGILPLRVGYWQTVLEDELSVEPFIEYNYYPSHFVNLGGRLNLKINNDQSLSLILGYAKGSALSQFFINQKYVDVDISRLYFGVCYNIIDRIFYPQQLRYNKK